MRARCRVRCAVLRSLWLAVSWVAPRAESPSWSVLSSDSRPSHSAHRCYGKRHCVFQRVSCCSANGSLIFHLPTEPPSSLPFAVPTREVDGTKPVVDVPAAVASQRAVAFERELHVERTREAYDSAACQTHHRVPVVAWGLQQDWNFGHMIMDTLPSLFMAMNRTIGIIIPTALPDVRLVRWNNVQGGWQWFHERMPSFFVQTWRTDDAELWDVLVAAERQPVCFDTLSVGMPDELDVWEPAAVDGDEREILWPLFREYLLAAAAVPDVDHDESERTAVTLIQRTGRRQWARPDELAAVIERGFSKVDVFIEVMEHLDLPISMWRLRTSRLAIAVAGAGLLHAVFLPPQSSVLVFIPILDPIAVNASMAVLYTLAFCALHVLAVGRLNGAAVVSDMNSSKIEIAPGLLRSVVNTSLVIIDAPLPRLTQRISWL